MRAFVSALKKCGKRRKRKALVKAIVIALVAFKLGKKCGKGRRGCCCCCRRGGCED